MFCCSEHFSGKKDICLIINVVRPEGFNVRIVTWNKMLPNGEDFQVWKPSYYERFLKEGVKKIKLTE